MDQNNADKGLKYPLSILQFQFSLCDTCFFFFKDNLQDQLTYEA